MIYKNIVFYIPAPTIVDGVMVATCDVWKTEAIYLGTRSQTGKQLRRTQSTYTVRALTIQPWVIVFPQHTY